MIAALTAKLTSGPVGSHTSRKHSRMYESPAVQELFFNTGEEPYNYSVANVDFIVIQTDAPVTVIADGVYFACKSLMVLDHPADTLQIVSTQFNTNVQLVVGRRG